MIWVIIFLIGLLGISFILHREIRILRKHDIDTSDVGEKALISREKVSDIGEQIWYNIKLYGHRIIISILKGWVLVTHKTNKYIQDKLTSRPEGNENGAVSTFLTAVSEYKQKMKKMRERIKQKED